MFLGVHQERNIRKRFQPLFAGLDKIHSLAPRAWKTGSSILARTAIMLWNSRASEPARVAVSSLGGWFGLSRKSLTPTQVVESNKGLVSSFNTFDK